MATSVKKQLLFLLSFIFFFSGFSSLIYEVVWERLLSVYYGVGVISITIIVSTYMFGLGLGALVGGFLAERSRDRLTLYFVIELLIGCFGLLSLPFLDFLGRYTAGSNYSISLFYIFLFLCMPTLLMGMTLPLLTKIFNRQVGNFLKTVSFLYFINTIGAALGAVFASYVIISFFGLDTAIYIAAAINLVLALLIFVSRYFAVEQPPEDFPALNEGVREEPIFGNTAYFLVFITGFMAIGYQIVWFRVVGVLVKASPYVFSSMLFVYLFGIALGSFWMGGYLRKQHFVAKKNLFFLIQFLIGLSVMAIFIGYYYLTLETDFSALTRTSFDWTLHPPAQLPLFSETGYLLGAYRLLDVFFWSFAFVFLPTLLMGASFPLISYLALSNLNREGQTIGAVYLVSILGNVLGSMFTGFLLLPYLGTENTLLMFSCIGILFGLFLTRLFGRSISMVGRTGLILALLLLNFFFFPKAGQLYHVMHNTPRFLDRKFEAFFEEGTEGIIMTYQRKERVINYMNGLRHGGRVNYSFYAEAIEAAGFTRKVENALVIGYGTGSFVEILLKINGIKKITLVEINSALIDNLRKMTVFENMLSDPKLELIIDDGRRFLLRTRNKYDLILIDPLRTTTSYSNNLYSRQFFELANRHLSDGGAFLVWMDNEKVIPKTVASAFNYVRMYDYFCLGSNRPFTMNQERKQVLLDSFPTEKQARITRDIKFLGNKDDIESMAKGYPVNQDWKPVCEYYLGLNQYDQER